MNAIMMGTLFLLKLGIFEQLGAIFSDPFFWALTVIFFGGTLLILRIFGQGNKGVSEEETRLAAQLEHHGFSYISSEVMEEAGPFLVVKKENTNSTTKPKSLFEEQPSKKTPSLAVQYRKLIATNKQGEKVEFWTKIVYKKNNLARVEWLPELEGKS